MFSNDDSLFLSINTPITFTTNMNTRSEIKFTSSILSNALWKSDEVPRHSLDEQKIKGSILLIDVCSLLGKWVKFGIKDEAYNREKFLKIVKSLEEQLDFEHNFIKIMWVFKAPYEYNTEPTPWEEDDYISPFLNDEDKLYELLKKMYEPSFNDCNNLNDICIKHAFLELHDKRRAFIAFDSTDDHFTSYSGFMSYAKEFGFTTADWLERCKHAIRNHLTYSALKKNIHKLFETVPQPSSSRVPRYVIHQSAYHWLKDYVRDAKAKAKHAQRKLINAIMDKYNVPVAFRAACRKDVLEKCEPITSVTEKYLLLPCSQTIDDDRFIESLGVSFTVIGKVPTTVLSADTDAFAHCPFSYHLRWCSSQTRYDIVYGRDVWEVALKGIDISNFTYADFRAILMLSKKCDQTGTSIVAHGLPSLDDAFIQFDKSIVIEQPILAFEHFAHEAGVPFDISTHPDDLLSVYLESVYDRSPTYVLGVSLMHTLYNIMPCIKEAERGINETKLKQSIITYESYKRK